MSTFLFSSIGTFTPLTDIESMVLVSPLSEPSPSFIVAVVVPFLSVIVMVATLPTFSTVAIGDIPSEPSNDFSHSSSVPINPLLTAISYAD